MGFKGKINYRLLKKKIAIGKSKVNIIMNNLKVQLKKKKLINKIVQRIDKII